jgi:hypothetical protein
MLKLLFIGDIVGRPGRDMVMERVPRLRQELALDFVIANAENVAAGAGITGKLAKSILESGVDAITLGDHVWDQRGWETEIAVMDRVCRPAISHHAQLPLPHRRARVLLIRLLHLSLLAAAARSATACALPAAISPPTCVPLATWLRARH